MTASFAQFQLKEYENISQAHFKTNEMMVAFFRYYLLIMALPFSFFGAAFAKATDSEKISLLSNWQIPIGVFLLVIAVLGICLMCYLISLRLEALLYARAVNGVRKYFYTQVDKPTDRIMPINTALPTPKNNGSFNSIIWSFIIFNSLYIVTAYLVFSIQVTIVDKINSFMVPKCNVLFIGLVCAVSIVVHLSLYFSMRDKHSENWAVNIEGAP